MPNMPPSGPMSMGGASPMAMSGPPSAPPEAPTLSAFPVGPGQGGPSPAGRVEAIPRLVFAIDQMLDTLARAVPGASPEIDSAKATIRGVLAKALQGGAAGKPSLPPGAPMPGGAEGPMR